MDGNKISTKPAQRETLNQSKKYHRYTDLALDTGKQDSSIFYPDGSRYFDDLVSTVSLCTTEDSPIIRVRGELLLYQRTGGDQIYFEDGYLTPLHKNNFVALVYVKEGQYHMQIEGKNYVFNQGDFFLFNRDVKHGEYYYQKNSTVVWLKLANSFFDKSINHNDIMLADKKSDELLRHFILNRNREYCFVLFTPQQQEKAPSLFKQIIDEMEHPQPGGTYIVIGYIKRLLSLLPLDYKVSVERKDGNGRNIFEEINRFLEERYSDVTMGDLIAAFGHNKDYINRLIKHHTGMTYTVFLQNIRLEKVEFLLKTTELPIEEIARMVGYKNLRYFYKIFTNRFQMKPNEMRKTNFETRQV